MGLHGPVSVRPNKVQFNLTFSETENSISLRVLPRARRTERRGRGGQVERERAIMSSSFSSDLPIQNLLILLFLLPVLLVSGKEEIGSKLSSKECEDLGFTGLALCSDCDTFSEYVKSQELVSDCRKCCTEESDDSISKVTYSAAILEVCMRKLIFYPDIVAFIEEEKDQFPAMKVRYNYASPPKLILLDVDGNEKETIRIDNWKREHIRQFLNEKIEKKKKNIINSVQ